MVYYKVKVKNSKQELRKTIYVIADNPEEAEGRAEFRAAAVTDTDAANWRSRKVTEVKTKTEWIEGALANKCLSPADFKKM